MSKPKRRMERRAFAISESELRDNGKSLTLEGYASTFEQDYDLGPFVERVARGAFSKTLNEGPPDLPLLINHDGLPLARTTSGNLVLSEDDHGLHVRASLDPSDPDVARIAPKMARRDLTGMSFGFFVVRDKWTEDRSHRTLTEISLAVPWADVSIVTTPANPHTSAALRSIYGAWLGEERLANITAAMAELRAGRVLSQENVDLLAEVLDTLGAVDQHVDDMTGSIAGLLDAANKPDRDNPVADTDTEVTTDPSDPYTVLSAPRLEIARRRLALLDI